MRRIEALAINSDDRPATPENGERCQSANDRSRRCQPAIRLGARRDPMPAPAWRQLALRASAPWSTRTAATSTAHVLGQRVVQTATVRASVAQRIGGAVGRAMGEHDTRLIDVNPELAKKARRERGSKGSWRTARLITSWLMGCRPRATMQVRVRADLLSFPQIMRLRAMRATKNHCRWQRRPSVEPVRHPRAPISCHRPPGHCNI
jgi:hypothetical protein